MIQTLFDGEPIPFQPRPKAFAPAPFAGASRNRLLNDWPIGILSADQEIRVSQKNLRARCRVVANDNPYMARFLNKAKENVIGSNGIAMQMAFDTSIPGADRLNKAVEDAWTRFCESVSADGQLNAVDMQQAAIVQLMTDGEVFQRKIDGYPCNPTRFAVQFLDPDQIDVMWNRLRRPDDPTQENEIRMGIEKDLWGRPVAYHAYRGHPSEIAGIVRIRIPAEQMAHAYVVRRVGQSRGVPWMHAAMVQLYMLGKYEEAELVASRLSACKQGYFVSKTGEEYTGGKIVKDEDGKKHGLAAEFEPGVWEELPEGITPHPVDWNHPNNAFAEFEKAMLRGVAVGCNSSYATLSGDLREVNFSSLRQGVLDEREGWKVLQVFARDHIVRPVFAWWLPMAITSGTLRVPATLGLDEIIAAAGWIPRGWDWVDPYKDSQTSIMAMRSCTSTLQAECAKQGKDYRDVLRQRAKENKEAADLGVSIDLTTSGAGGLEGDTQGEIPERGIPPAPSDPGKGPAKPAAPPPPKKKPNGQGALLELEQGGLPQ